MQQIDDEARWYEAWLDTPLSVDRERQRKARVPDDLLDAVGVHLKSRDTAGPLGFPSHFGVLAKYTDDEVIVRSKFTSKNHKCIWIGTPRQYVSMWTVD